MIFSPVNRESEGMGTAGTLMSVEEYLKYSGKPNFEYIDGILRPKAMLTSLHGLIKFLLRCCFAAKVLTRGQRSRSG
jgi:hypothetical protein